MTAPLPGECGADVFTNVLFHEGFENGEGTWTHGFNNAAGVAPVDTWAVTNTHSYSGDFAFHARAVDQVSDQYLVSPELTLPQNSELLTLQFWHDRDIEFRTGGGCYDGAILEVSADTATEWAQVGPEALLTDPYDGEVVTKYNNPIAGQPAWCGNSQGWIHAVVDLGAYAGQSLRFRFRIATDNSFGQEGWYIDEVQVNSCLSTQGTLLYLPLVSNMP
jgi:bacillopeptidase F (M6 metalloprotease family)